MLGRLSFRAKLLVGGALVQLLLLGLVLSSDLGLMQSTLRQEILARAEHDRPFLTAALARPFAWRDHAALEDVLATAFHERGLAYAVLTDAAGEIIAARGDPPRALGRRNVEAGVDTPSRGADGAERFDFTHEVMLAGQVVGAVHYGIPASVLADARQRLVRNTGLLALLGLAGSLVLFAAIGIALARPVEQLVHSVRQMRAGNYDVRVPVATSDEIGELARNVERMAQEVKDRIAQLVDSELVQRRLLEEARARETQLEIERGRAEVAAEAKSRFLARMSHEIRTPLNGVLGMLEVLSQGSLEASQRRTLEIARSSSEALLAILADVLEFSNAEEGRMNLDRVRFRPGEVVHDVIERFRVAARGKGIELISAFDVGEEHVLGDPVRLRQVLFNLLANAVKYTDRGRVVVRAQTEADAGSAGDGPLTIKLQVEDTGIGIPEESLERVFEPFQQVDDSTTRRHGGLGLGLAITRRIVEAMSGSIEVASSPGLGSIFTVRVPLDRCSEREPEVVALAPARSTRREINVETGLGMHVLVAEDNPVNRLHLQAMLTRLGCTHETVDDGRRAVDAYRAGDFDVILMDCHMPEMDGIEATERIRALERGLARPRTPILAVTAAATAEDRARTFAAGMDEHLAKPISMASLRAALERSAKPRRSALEHDLTIPEGGRAASDRALGRGQAMAV